MYKIMVLGIGKAGCNVIEAMRSMTKHPYLICAQYVVADCDINELDKHRHNGITSILLHSDSEEFPKETFNDVEQLIIVAGMSGFAGSKYSVVAAATASEVGIKSVFVLGILGFLFEGKRRIICSLESLKKIGNMPGISLEIFNMEALVVKYEDWDIFSTLEKSNELIIGKIEEIVIIKDEGYSWNGYSIIGDTRELDDLINCLEGNGINKYDVLNTLTLNGNNCVASSEGTKFLTTLNDAFRNLLLYKTEKLLLIIRCGNKLPSMSEVSSIYPILADVGILDSAMVKLDIVKDKGLGDSFKVYIVASRNDSF